MPKKIFNNIQVFKFYFADNIKNLYINKVNKKSCLIMDIYNDKKKILYQYIYQKYQKFAKILVFILLLFFEIIIITILNFIYKILYKYILKLP